MLINYIKELHKGIKLILFYTNTFLLIEFIFLKKYSPILRKHRLIYTITQKFAKLRAFSKVKYFLEVYQIHIYVTLL